jgi:uncharacterized protein YkwD
MRKISRSLFFTQLRRGRSSATALLFLLPLLLFTAVSFAQSYDPNAEQEIVRLVNRERQSRGLATLVIDERLVQAARKHSERMAAAGYLEHQFRGEPKLSLRLGDTGLRFDTDGENVALAVDAARAHTALMNSPHHRANILDSEYNTIGIGVVRTHSGIFVTQDFARRLREVSVDEAENKVAADLNRLRRSIGQPSLSRIPAPELRRRACQMAAEDRLNPRVGLSSPKVSNSVAFTAIDLSEIPESLGRLKTSRASGFSVGACYQTSASYDTPVFWIIAVTYF